MGKRLDFAGFFATVALLWALGWLVLMPAVPGIYGDDMFWEFDPGFYRRDYLLSEGRWLVEGWFRLFGVHGREGGFRLDLLAIAVTAAATARALTSEGRPVLTGLLALLLAANPALLWQLKWPLTSVPMLVALGVLTCLVVALRRAPRRELLAGLGAAVAVAVPVYQLWVFYLAGLAALVLLPRSLRVHRPARAAADLLLVAVTLAAAAGAATLAVMALNGVVFGQWGIRVAGHREIPGGGAAGLGAAAANILGSIDLMRRMIGLAVVPVFLLLVAWAAQAAARSGRPGWARAGLVALLLPAIALAPYALPAVLGIAVPGIRGLVAFWLAEAGAVALWLRFQPASRLGFAALGLLLGLALLSTLFVRERIEALAGATRENALTAAGIVADWRAAGGPERPLLMIGGDGLFADEAADQPWWWRAMVLRMLGAPGPVTVCAADCLSGRPELARAFAGRPAWPAPGSVVAEPDRVVIVVGPVGAE